MSKVVEKLNSEIHAAHKCVFLKKAFPLPAVGRQIRQDTLKHLLQEMVHEMSVTNPNTLRKYKGFLAKVYGETGFDAAEQILDAHTPREGSQFPDLGLEMSCCTSLLNAG